MAAMHHLVEEVERSYAETQERLSDPSVYNDHREAAEVGRRLKELEAAHKLAQEWLEASSDLEAARGDGDLRELVPELEERVEQLEQELKLALVESDPADRKDVIVEIRQAAGGDEAALWAGDVFRMLTRYAERRGFTVEQLEASGNESGGFKEVVFAVKGDGAYSIYKWEAGTHRVQRVPETESQGRVHTSTATVAVDVWMRPCDSVEGTRCTRCVPPSHLNTEYAPSPFTAKTTSLKPPDSFPLASSCSTVYPRRSA